MSQTANPNEDWRGVDVGQIRRQLRMTTKDRVRDMVHAANVIMKMQENARVARAKDQMALPYLESLRDEIRRQEAR